MWPSFVRNDYSTGGLHSKLTHFRAINQNCRAWVWLYRMVGAFAGVEASQYSALGSGEGGVYQLGAMLEGRSARLLAWAWKMEAAVGCWLVGAPLGSRSVGRLAGAYFPLQGLD